MDIVKLSGRDKKKLVQLALPLEKVKKEKLTFPMFWSKKIDGVLCLAFRDETGEVGIFSRTGERYTSMRHLEESFGSLMNPGEIIIFEAFSAITKDQSTISGWCRDTKNQHPELSAACHTLLTIYEFQLSGGRSFHAISNELGRIIDKSFTEDIVLVPQYQVDSLEEAMKLTEFVWKQGGEGGILRNPNSVYQGGKRNQDIIKIKQGVSYDLKVIDTYEGKGKYKGTLGGLICQWKNGETIRISGMTDSQRKLWWENPELIIGQIVQVDAMTESSKGKLREPRFKGIREDKLEGDF